MYSKQYDIYIYDDDDDIKRKCVLLVSVGLAQARPNSNNFIDMTLMIESDVYDKQICTTRQLDWVYRCVPHMRTMTCYMKQMDHCMEY